MQCHFCETPAPSQAHQANFCANCGRPLTQLCPYPHDRTEVEEPQKRLALTDSNGRATAFCPDCGGLFLACPSCRRLHRLDSHACLTCQRPLIEPIPAFPTPRGPVNGTRRAEWPGAMPVVNANLPFKPLRVVEPLEQIIFRYGLLIGVTRSRLVTYEWDGARWEKKQAQRLLPSGEIRICSLLAEQGRILVLGQDRALSFSLVGGLQQEMSQPETSQFQAIAASFWIRVGANVLRWNHIEVHGMNEQTRELSLPAEAGQVKDIAVTDRVYLATDQGYILSFEPREGQLKTLLQQPLYSWQRVAVREGWGVVLGSQKNTPGKLVFQPFALDGSRAPGATTLREGCLPEFAWSENSLYVPCSQMRSPSQRVNTVEVYEWNRLTAPPRSLSLSAGMILQAEILALYCIPKGQAARALLLLRGVDRNAQQFHLLDPATQNPQTLGPFKTSDRAFNACLADAHLITAILDNGGTELLTF